MRIVIHDSTTALPDAWDTLVGDGSPFLERTFLRLLETTGCATEATGWAARPVCVYDGDRLVAGAPAWLTSHSMGEFVYDHAWANAAATNNLPYYPKVVVAVPFTPVTGRRLLLAPGAPPDALPALMRGLQQVAKGAHGLHVLFNTEHEASALADQGGFTRIQYQYWWKNRDYRDWDGFLAALTTKARKNLRRERRDLTDYRFERVLNPNPAQLDHLFRFYVATTQRYAWGKQYLTRAFFEALAHEWRDRILGVLAWRGERCIAGAFNVVKSKRLYGRYWGADEAVPFLHFEVCYYQGIDHCIAHGLEAFEPGHGGEHKYRRGFLPEITRSNHWLAHRGLHEALARHTRQETDWVLQQVRELQAKSVYRA